MMTIMNWRKNVNTISSFPWDRTKAGESLTKILVVRIKFLIKILVMNHVERFRAVMNFEPVDRLWRIYDFDISFSSAWACFARLG
jgi:hypothetical protein